MMRHFPPVDSKDTLDVRRASNASGVDVEVIEHLIALRIIKPLGHDAAGDDVLGLHQVPLVEIIAAMDVLNFRIEEMRDMVQVVEVLGALPASDRAARYRIRLGAFVNALEHRAAVTHRQIESKALLLSVLRERYVWLTG